MNVGHAIKWSFLSEIASKAVQPLVFVILARLLTPEDFGVVAAAVMVISFSQIFWEAGMGKAVIQYQGDSEAAANAAFWVNNALGVLVAGALVAISGVVADNIFHDPRVAPVLQVMSLQVFLSASASVHTALLQKEMEFKRLFWVRFATVTFPGFVSIPLALQGMGYWALVGGALVGQAAQVVLLWRMSLWRPSLTMDRKVAGKLLRFGGWVALSGLLGWFYVWADSLIVGMYLGARELGLYRTGNQFVMMVYGFLFGPLLPVLYSYFSGIQHDSMRIREVLFRVMRIITFIAVPTALLLYALAEPLAEAVFGSHWQGVGMVIAILALMHGFSWIVGANGEAYRAIGRPDYETKIIAGTLAFYLVGYWASIQHGFEIFLWTRLGLALAAFNVHLLVARVALGFSMTKIYGYAVRITVACIPLVFIGNYINFFGESFWQTTFLWASLGVAWITLSLWFFERNGLIPELLGVMKRKRFL